MTLCPIEDLSPVVQRRFRSLARRLGIPPETMRGIRELNQMGTGCEPLDFERARRILDELRISHD